MMDLANLQLAELTLWQHIAEVFTTPSLQLFLILGSFLLVISLILLTMTRLGHARPITKCVVLSVIAHVLLLGFAYGTRLMFHVPVADNSQAIQVNIENLNAKVPELPIADDSESLNDFSSENLEIETEPLARPVQDVPFELERTVEWDETPLEPEESKEFVDIALFKVQKPQFNIEQPDIVFGPSDVDDDPAPEPNKIDFERYGEKEFDIQSHEPEIEPFNDNDFIAAENNETVVEQPEVTKNESLKEADRRIEQFVSELELPDADDMVARKMEIETSKSDEHRYQNSNKFGTVERIARQIPRRLGDGLEVPEAYRLRVSPERMMLAKTRGASEASENGVRAGLAWLAKSQQSDGRWCPKETGAGKESKVFGHDRGGCGSDAETGITSLATLAFLGAGHNHLEGQYQQTVQNALQFIINQQRSNGDLSGNAKLFARMYCHSMSLLAISEAFAISGDRRLEKAVRLGVEFSIDSQNTSDGGWRYQPGDSGDMSQFGWKVMALTAAKNAGIQIPVVTIKRMQHFLEQCKTGDAGGLASYRPGQGPSSAMTAESLVCRNFLGSDISAAGLQEAQTRILSELPNHRKINLYYWYYATMALQQSGGESWEYWNVKLQRVLLSQQVSQGEFAGSWSPDGLWAGYGGRIYSTAMAALCLEVYYRYQMDDTNSYTVRNTGEPGNSTTFK